MHMADEQAKEQQSLLSEKALAEATSDPAARIEALRREIEHNSYLYYAKDAPALIIFTLQLLLFPIFQKKQPL